MHYGNIKYILFLFVLKLDVFAWNDAKYFINTDKF